MSNANLKLVTAPEGAFTYGYSNGPENSVEVKPLTDTWEQLTARLRVPEIGSKSGSYITCSPFNHNIRNGKNLDGQTGAFFVIDADSMIDLTTGEVFSSDKGAPPPKKAHKVLKKYDIPHIIFSTHSNGTKGHRYRILIPVSWSVSKENLAMMYHWTLGILHDAEVGVNLTTESLTPAQLWYLPRVPDRQALEQYYFAEYDGGQPFPLDEVTAWWRKNKSRFNVKREISKASFDDTTALDLDTPIGRYNTNHGVEWITRQLAKNGYEYRSQGAFGASAAYRFLHPNSGSESPGTVLFKTDRGVWRVYSHSGNDKMLSDGFAHDAFDIHTLFDHNGDQRAALEGLGLLQAYTIEELEKMVEDADMSNREERATIIQRLAGSKLSDVDTEDVMKLIAEKFKTAIGAIRKDITARKKKAAKAAKGFSEPLDFGISLARDCLNSYGSNNVIFSEGRLWVWEKRGVWRTYPSEYLDRQIIHAAFISKYPDWDFNSAIVGDMRNLIKSICAISGGMHPKNKSEHYINCLNGELHWSIDKEVWELWEHDRNNYATNQCNFNASSTAECPRWDDFLLEVLANTGTDADIAEQIELLQALIGYTMTGSTMLEKFIYLWSNLGGSGKSIFLVVLKALLGRDSYSAVQPDQFANRFQVAHMDKMLANVVTEIEYGVLLPAAKMKAIASGEAVTIEHKGQDPFETEITATLWQAANQLNNTKDPSDAFFQRAVVLKFPNKFRETAAQDFSLDKKLLNELEGIARRCLDSYGRLLVQIAKGGGMQIPKVVKRNVEEWRHESDPVRHFIEDCIVIDSKSTVTHVDVYREYEMWCERTGARHPVQQRTLTNRLIQILSLEKRQKGAGNVAVLRGIAINRGQTTAVLPSLTTKELTTRIALHLYYAGRGAVVEG